MTKITSEAKEVIIKKALSRNGKTLIQIASENNVGYSTLAKWLRLKRKNQPIKSKTHDKNPTIFDQPSKLAHVLAAANLDETAISAYCRKQGIFSFQLQQWQDELMSDSINKKNVVKDRDEIKALRNENKRLKQDLSRKEKALAETSALLVLKKKADLIWGDFADD